MKYEKILNEYENVVKKNLELDLQLKSLNMEIESLNIEKKEIKSLNIQKRFHLRVQNTCYLIKMRTYGLLNIQARQLLNSILF